MKVMFEGCLATQHQKAVSCYDVNVVMYKVENPKIKNNQHQDICLEVDGMKVYISRENLQKALTVI